MEKLIKLLNRFEREVYPEDHKYIRFPDGTDTDWWYWRVWDWFNFTKKWELYYSEPNTFRKWHEELLIVSKSYGFIQRLVENDKIKSSLEWWPSEIMIDDLNWTMYNLADSILMILSISDNPISDLCSFLEE